MFEICAKLTIKTLEMDQCQFLQENTRPVTDDIKETEERQSVQKLFSIQS